MSVMMKDLLNTYKLGWKTSYYQNTYDYKTDDDIVFEEPAHSLGWHDETKSEQEDMSDEECEACNI
jgi:ribonucleoside-diphosphate reductase alpha chain